MMLFYTFVETKKKKRNNVAIVYWKQFHVTRIVYIKVYLCMLH